ncbi:MAG TPA: flagellar biosynthesis protein FlhB [Syntrophomonadaceae bacterium]|nr:flagellar biosynthesis protein FlhB [Syntrophomonadaceae bacterium]
MTEKRERAQAVALRYNPEQDTAPLITAKGQGYLAERIEQIARESGVPIRQDEEMAEYLMALDLYTQIPPELYTVVAEILAHIYAMDQRYRGRLR